MSNTVKFGYRVQRSDGSFSTKKYPHELKGTPKYNLATRQTSDAVHGVDREAVQALRDGRRADKTIGLTARNAGRVAQELVDGPGITASEIPVLKAARYAAEGRVVQVTDATGHWRTLTATRTGAERFLELVRGVKIVKPAVQPTPATPTPPSAPAGSDVVASLQGAVDGLGRWHESGDNGVDTRVVHLEGAASAQAALDAVLQRASGGMGGELLPTSGREALEAFRSSAAADLEEWRATFYDVEPPPVADEHTAAMQAYDRAVDATFAPLGEIRAARGNAGEGYLLGRVRDGYVSLVMWPYRDG